MADALADHSDTRLRSLSLHATADHLWRVDHATGPLNALDDVEKAFLAADYYADRSSVILRNYGTSSD